MRCLGCMEEVSGGRQCSCGFKPGGHNPAYLKPGTVLSSRYVVGRLLRNNGESGFYIGFDKNIQKKIWIREYYPSSLAGRDKASGVVIPRDGLSPQYKALMSDFLELCGMIARLGKTGAVVPVSQVFEENNTAYAVSPYIAMTSLESHIARQQDNRLAFAQALKLLDPLFTAVQKLHDMGGIHRGISPYTVYVDSRGRIYLGDFLVAAARTDASELESELFNGYSAPEQYAANRWQGAWTDIYALGALLYRVVSGVVPPKATLISDDRPLPRLSGLAPDVSGIAADAVEKAMLPRPADRTQTVVKFRAELQERPSSEGNTAVFDTSAFANGDRDQHGDDDEDYYYGRERKPATFKFLAFALLLTVAVLVGFLYLIVSTLMPDAFDGGGRPGASQVSRPGTPASATANPEPPSASPDPAPEVDHSVPRFIGRSISEITDNDSYSTRFIFDIREQFSHSFAAGIVYDQTPPQGILMPNRGTVILYVSKGAARMEMPDLAGLNFDEAMELVFGLETELELPPIRIDPIVMFDPNVTPGLIVRTDPPAGDYYYPDRGPMQIFFSTQLHVDIPEEIINGGDPGDNGLPVSPYPPGTVFLPPPPQQQLPAPPPGGFLPPS
ncbi:MAG: protein kinase [Oscillospiraceae bacterium]|nr:protein kinase [Oscillospiraceae bacterium]